MKLLTQDLRNKLTENGRQQEKVRGTDKEIDFHPVVKLFTPDANCTWLLTEIDPEEPDIAFGLCDLGMGFPELGSVSLSELESLRGALGLPLERDLHFQAEHPLSAYTRAASKAACITTDRHTLIQANHQAHHDKRLDPDYQRKVSDFVSREVIYCVSTLVSEFASKDEDFYHIFRTFDPDRAREMIDEASQDDPERENDLGLDDLDLNDPEDLQNLFQELDLDISEAEAEVYEHWIVTDWLAGKLALKGETIERDFHGLTIWGRCCTGQAISLDDVICTIFDETTR